MQPQGPYGIRTRAAAVRGRCPRPLDEWAVRRGSVPNPGRRVACQRVRRPASRARRHAVIECASANSRGTGGALSASRLGICALLVMRPPPPGRQAEDPRPALDSELLHRRAGSRRLAVAGVDPGLEAAADALTRREERVVMRASRRQLDDTNGFVSIAMAACIGGRLVEGPEAIAVPPKLCHTGHLPRLERRGNPTRRQGSALCRRNGGPRVSSRACTTTGSSCVPTRRSTGGRR